MPWKCPVCGFENSDDALYCIRCGAQRPANPPTSEVNQQVPPPPPVTVNVGQQPTPSQSQQVPPPPPVTVNPLPEAQASQQQQPQTGTQQSGSTTEQQQVVVQPPQIVPQHKYYLLVIQTPYSGLINQKIPLNLDIFPAISVGRSPENVIIFPDPEVSRRHAVITLEGGELYIEDLNSTNGTYIYDGKLFQPVKGKQKLPPNSIIKFGNQTIVKLVAE